MVEGGEDGQEEGERERSLKKFSSGKCLGTSERVKFNTDQSNNCKNQKPSDVFKMHVSQITGRSLPPFQAFSLWLSHLVPFIHELKTKDVITLHQNADCHM